MKIVVTGIGGLIGSYLVEELLGQSATVIGCGRKFPTDLEPVRDRFQFVPLDVTDAESVCRLIQDHQPDFIYHLAAQSLPMASWQDPTLTVESNVIGSLNVMRATLDHSPSTRLLLAGSSSEYASHPDGKPIKESDPLRASSPYAASKISQSFFARLYSEVKGLRAVTVRPFFLIGPRKVGDVSSSFARGIVSIERGERTDLPVGNMSAIRDLLDVRDGVTAIRTIAESGANGEVYNVCSGDGFEIRSVLDRLKTMAKVEVVERPDPALLRPADEPIKIGDPAKTIALGWRPTRSIDQTLSDILDYWRAQANP